MVKSKRSLVTEIRANFFPDIGGEEPRECLRLVDILESLDQSGRDSIRHQILDEGAQILSILKRGPFRQPALDFRDHVVTDRGSGLDTGAGAGARHLEDRILDPEGGEVHLLA